MHVLITNEEGEADYCAFVRAMCIFVCCFFVVFLFFLFTAVIRTDTPHTGL